MVPLDANSAAYQVGRLSAYVLFALLVIVVVGTVNWLRDRSAGWRRATFNGPVVAIGVVVTVIVAAVGAAGRAH